MISIPNGRQRVLRAISIGTIVVGAVTIGTLRAQSVPPQSPVTYAKDIAPMLQRSCQNCHRPNGGIAPMSLTTYEEVRPWANAIKTRTGRREMPPWFMDKNIGIQHFKDDISLSDAEIATIGKWVDAGAPLGNPADAPPPLHFNAGNVWAIGEPDVVVKSPLIHVSAVGADQFPGFVGKAPTGLTEDRWIQKWEVREVRPGQQQSTQTSRGFYFVVHHESIGTMPEAGGEGAGEPLEVGEGEHKTVSDVAAGAFRHTYEVGQNAQEIPPGVGVPLKAGSYIYFNSGHLHPIGKEVTAQLEVAFKLYPKGYVPKYPNRWRELPRAGALGGLGEELDIPANTDNIETHKTDVLDEPRKILSFEPHLHAGGKRMCMEAIYPDGRRETLNCAGYKHGWVKAYVYQDDYAPLLPKGTILNFTAWYNNTPSNPFVADPRNWRGLGPRSIDEMFIFLGKTLVLTEEEYKAEVAAREQRMKERTLTLSRVREAR